MMHLKGHQGESTLIFNFAIMELKPLGMLHKFPQCAHKGENFRMTRRN
jgi:hypothetical protein